VIELAAAAITVGAVTAVLVALRARPGAQRRLEADLRALALGNRGELEHGHGLPALVLVSELGALRLRYRLGGGEGVPGHTTLTLGLPRLLPALRIEPLGFHAGDAPRFHDDELSLGEPRFDRWFRVHADDHGQARALLGMAVRQAFLELRDQAGVVDELRVVCDCEAGCSRLELRLPRLLRDDFSLRPVREGFLGLAAALLACWDAPWMAAAGAYGLEPVAPGVVGCLAYDGEVDGFRLRIEERYGPQGLGWEVLANPGTSFPLELRHLEDAREQGWADARIELGSPVLDMLVAARAPSAERARALLRGEELTAALLAVVHANPGSSLSQDGVSLVAQGHPAGRLDAAVDDVLALARALRDGLARLQDQA
jgi:hypothetical protein